MPKGPAFPEQTRAAAETLIAQYGEDAEVIATLRAAEFAAIRGISIDYAVLEQASDVAVIEAPPELVEAVQKAELATIEAFNKGDAAALAALFAEKGELVDENGNVYSGREQIAGLFKAFFERFPKAELQMEVTGVRTVGDSRVVGRSVSCHCPDASRSSTITSPG